MAAGRRSGWAPIRLLALLAALLVAWQPAAASGRAALSIRPPAWITEQADQDAVASELAGFQGVAPFGFAPAGPEGRQARGAIAVVADQPARPARHDGGDSESRSDSEGCDEGRARSPPSATEEEEANAGQMSAAELHLAAQPWWGRIAGAPTLAEFSFDGELVARCANRRAAVPMTRLPLSLDPNVYQQMLMSQATCTGRAYGEPAPSGERESWEDVCSMVPEHMADVMPQNSRFESCAVVGNSGNLLKTRFGAEIDLHAVVMRFNDAPTVGFEKYVGSKTDYRIMNKHRFHIFSHDGRSVRGGRQKVIPKDKHATIVVSHESPEAMAPDMHAALNVKQLHRLDINFTAMSNHVHDYTNEAMGAFVHCLEIRSKEARISKVTSGVKAVLTAMHMCKRVSVYGVGDTSLSDSSVPYQYFSESGEWSGRDEVSPHHNLSLEEAFLHALARSDLIRHCRYKGCQGGYKA